MTPTAAPDRVNPLYLVSAFGLTLLAPALCWALDPSPASAVKWMAFWAVGVRLGLAGLRQLLNPRFTAQTIFGVADPASFPIVREVGMANLSFATLGLASALVPAWRLAAILAGGMYYGLAAAVHLGHKPATKNEAVGLVSDVLAFLALAAAFVAGF
jgi:hypothetical protein